jgi:hypothetical protein
MQFLREWEQSRLAMIRGPVHTQGDHMTDVAAFLESVADIAREHGVFGEVQLLDNTLRCRAKDAAAEAWYTVARQHDGWSVSLSTADRWLSESIETDLMHFGDPMEELIEEELVELGGEGPVEPPKHYRADDRSYVFTSRVPMAADQAPAAAAAHVATWLLAYEAAFRNLGDMAGGDEE